MAGEGASCARCSRTSLRNCFGKKTPSASQRAKGRKARRFQPAKIFLPFPSGCIILIHIYDDLRRMMQASPSPRELRSERVVLGHTSPRARDLTRGLMFCSFAEFDICCPHYMCNLPSQHQDQLVTSHCSDSRSFIALRGGL